MDYREYIKNPLSLGFIDKLVQIIELQPNDFTLIYSLIYDDDVNVAWRAAWACQKISEKNPFWFTERNFYELTSLSLSTTHGGLKRGCLAILNNIPTPQPLPVDLLNACFDWMISLKNPIAVQALSLKLLYKFCLIEPDLQPELIAYLDNFATSDLSPGMISIRRKIIKSLLNK